MVGRLMGETREARKLGCDLTVFTESALTAFLPHWWIEGEADLDAWFEREMPRSMTQGLFNEAGRPGIGCSLGHAEFSFEAGVKRRYNTSVLVGAMLVFRPDLAR